EFCTVGEEFIGRLFDAAIVVFVSPIVDGELVDDRPLDPRLGLHLLKLNGGDTEMYRPNRSPAENRTSYHSISARSFSVSTRSSIIASLSSSGTFLPSSSSNLSSQCSINDANESSNAVSGSSASLTSLISSLSISPIPSSPSSAPTTIHGPYSTLA